MRTKYFDESERRVHVRYGATIPVRFRVVTDGREGWLNGEARNLSRGGIMLAILEDRHRMQGFLGRDRPAPGVELEMTLRGPDGAAVREPLRAVCSLRWVKNPTLFRRHLLLGLRFDTISERERQSIREYIVHTFVERYPDHRES